MNRLFFEALSQTLFYSLLHGSFIFLAYKLSAFLLRNHTIWRYRMTFFTLLLLLADFIGNLYLKVSSVADSARIRYADVQPQTTYLDTIQGWFTAHSQMLGYMYLAGFCVCSLWMLTGFTGLHFAKRKQHLQPDEEWLKRLQFFADETGIRKKVQLFLSMKNTVPCTFGFFRPVIVMPLAMLAQLSYAQMETILLHELAHIRRNDYLMNLCQCLIENLLFFNPFAWLISRDIRIVRELCCDDFVINYGKDPVIYAETLAIIEHHRFTREQLALNANGPKAGSLFHRILRITHMKKTALTPHLKLVVVLMMFTAIAALAFTPEKKILTAGRSKSSLSLNIISDNYRQDTSKKNRKAKPVMNRNSNIPPPPPPLQAGKKTSSKKTSKKSNKKTEQLEIVEPAVTAEKNGNIPPPPPPPREPNENTSAQPATQKVDEIELLPPGVQPDRNGNVPPPPPPAEPKKNRRAGSSKQTAGKIKFPPPAKERNETHQETKKGTVKFPPPTVTPDKSSPAKN